MNLIARIKSITEETHDSKKIIGKFILDNQNELFLKAYRKCCASKGMLDADDICGTLVFLLSDESKFITGQTLVVDDGWGL